MGVQSPSTLPTLCPFLKDTNCKVPATGMTLEKKTIFLICNRNDTKAYFKHTSWVNHACMCGDWIVAGGFCVTAADSNPIP